MKINAGVVGIVLTIVLQTLLGMFYAGQLTERVNNISSTVVELKQDVKELRATHKP